MKITNLFKGEKIGLFDYDNTEIKVGDILQSQESGKDFPERMTLLTSHVVYESNLQSMFRFLVKNRYSNHIDIVAVDPLKTYKIIGNYYDNPELWIETLVLREIFYGMIQSSEK